MNSVLYRGAVEHQRLAPTGHRFRYGASFFAFDLAELASLGRGLPGFGYNRIRPVALHDGDYLDRAPGTIAEKLARRLADAGIRDPAARTVLITAARRWNYVFNPVSFYLGLDAADRPQWAVAEVNNTFGDRHLYVLADLRPAAAPGVWTATAAKAMHVSPFNGMEGQYTFSFRYARDAVDIRVDLQRDGRKVFLSRLRGRGVPLARGPLWRDLLQRPLATALTMPQIIFEAARLRFARKLAVHARTEPASPDTIVRRAPGRLERWAGTRLLATLARLRHGALEVRLPDGSVRRFGRADGPADAALMVRRQRAFRRILLGGEVGLGEAFVDGDFTSPDIAQLLRLLIANREAFGDGNFVTALAGRLRDRLAHLRRENTRRRSRHNIHAHYDLGNDFYELFLDRTFTYSCGLFEGGARTLEEAQDRKLEVLIAKARIRPEHHVLEIGCGWGAFAIEAVRRTGCRVTAITVSEQQLQLATARVRAAGLEGRIDIRLCDYRDLRGTFDRVVSIEMIEAVGHRFLPSFFARIDALLAPQGLVVVQAITIPDHRYESYRKGSDWIQKHIFPGGHLPSLGAIQDALTARTRLHVEGLENIGPHYATTLRHWRARFDAQEPRVRALGFDDCFVRKWRYYLAYCEAAFGARTLNTLQLVLTRPNNHDLDAPPRVVLNADGPGVAPGVPGAA